MKQHALWMVLIAATLSSAGSPRVEVLEPPRRRLGKRIVLVVDGSGSMKGKRTRTALAQVSSILSQPTDAYRVAVVVFSDSYMVRNTDGRTIWEKMPSETGRKRIIAWLEQRIGHGFTQLAPALEWSMRKKNRADVVVISDGVIHDSERVLPVFRTSRRRGSRSTVATLAVADVGTKNVLRRLGRQGAGGAFRGR